MRQKPQPAEFGITELDIENDRLFKELSKNGPTNKDVLKRLIKDLALSMLFSIFLGGLIGVNGKNFFIANLGKDLGESSYHLLSFSPVLYTSLVFVFFSMLHYKTLHSLALSEEKRKILKKFRDSEASYLRQREEESRFEREAKRAHDLEEREKRDFELRKKVSFWQSLDGKLFEKHVASLLLALGYKNVSLTPPTKDAGIDIFAQDIKGYNIIFQCKAHSAAVGVGSARDLLGTLTSFSAKANHAVLVSASGFTQGAVEFAKNNNIFLWSVHDLVSFSAEVSYDKRLLNLNVEDFNNIDYKRLP